MKWFLIKYVKTSLAEKIKHRIARKSAKRLTQGISVDDTTGGTFFNKTDVPAWRFNSTVKNNTCWVSTFKNKKPRAIVFHLSVWVNVKGSPHQAWNSFSEKQQKYFS